MKRSNLFKRSAAMLLAGLMAVSMSACGGSSASGNDSGDSQASSSGDTHKLSVVLKTTSSEYWSYVIAGIEQAEKDFAFIHEIPGRKIILKGNHDYWWNTAAKFYKFCAAHGWDDMFILNNNCYYYGDTALCGTRGWFYEQEQEGTHDEKIFRRELGRLEASFKAAGEHEKMCFLHYPPRYRGYECPEILELLARYGVKHCFYGHLHAESMRLAIQGSVDGCEFRLLSSDYVNFKPQKLLD